jgi:hypothetical protein
MFDVSFMLPKAAVALDETENKFDSTSGVHPQ